MIFCIGYISIYTSDFPAFGGAISSEKREGQKPSGRLKRPRPPRQRKEEAKVVELGQRQVRTASKPQAATRLLKFRLFRLC